METCVEERADQGENDGRGGRDALGDHRTRRRSTGGANEEGDEAKREGHGVCQGLIREMRMRSPKENESCCGLITEKIKSDQNV